MVWKGHAESKDEWNLTKRAYGVQRQISSTVVPTDVPFSTLFVDLWRFAVNANAASIAQASIKAIASA